MCSSVRLVGQHGGCLLLLVLLSLVGRTVQQRDPVNNFCRRWGHQTAVVDDRLYVDGGIITWNPMAQFPENYTNPYFIYHDLSVVADSGMPPPHANLSKNSSIPSVHGGVLWPDEVNKRIYLYGGEFQDHTPWPFSLYAYDIINDLWEAVHPAGAWQTRALSYGAGLSLSSRGKAYYYGGWMNNRTDGDWGNHPGQVTSYLLQYDMDANAWSNQTGPDDIGRAEGAMVHIPAGDGGMLVYLGGIRGRGNGTWDAQPMDEIILFDVLSGKSYIQNATGRVPEHRRKFCAGATWAEDQSSYNIYLYGGAGEEPGSLGFDDVYVLSIPSFTWVRMYPNNSNSTGDFPHHSLSCNVVNTAQMLIHGGYFPGTDDCDSEEQWGLHNLDMGKQNKDKSPWALYEPNKTRYVVPDDIISAIGGSPDGGATETAPAGGYMHRDLGVLLTRTASVAERTATRSVQGPTGSHDDEDDKGRLGPGVIAGIAVGGAVGLIALAMGCFCFVRRHRSKTPQSDPQRPITQDHPHNGPLHPFSWQARSLSSSAASPSVRRPETVQPYEGPPVELPSGDNQYSEMAHPSPFSETASATEPKYDAYGNAWWPQASVMQGPGSARSPSGNSVESLSPFPSSQPRREHSRSSSTTRSPWEMDFEMIRGTGMPEQHRVSLQQAHDYQRHQQY